MVWAFSRLAFGRPEWGDTFLTLQLLNIKVFPFVVKEELITSSVCKILGWSILIQLFAGHSNTSSLTSYISSLRDKLTCRGANKFFSEFWNFSVVFFQIPPQKWQSIILHSARLAFVNTWQIQMKNTLKSGDSLLDSVGYVHALTR